MLAPLTAVVLAAASDPVPSDNNVKAGWVGFAVVILLIVAVVFLLRSFTKQLRKVEHADEQGVYDEEPARDPGRSDLPPTTTERDR
jgi:TRAP-type C4-dicarboxylate transport system permease small subunit